MMESTCSMAHDACARRFDGRVERKQIGLPGNSLDEAYDLADACRRSSQLRHCRNGALSFRNRAARYLG